MKEESCWFSPKSNNNRFKVFKVRATTCETKSQHSKGGTEMEMHVAKTQTIYTFNKNKLTNFSSDVFFSFDFTGSK